MVLSFTLILLITQTTCLASKIRKGPYLIYPDDNTQMNVLWQLTERTTWTLKWWTISYEQVSSAQVQQYGNYHQFKHTITELTPGEKYLYSLTCDGHIYPGSFHAGPDETDQKLNFFVIGDTQGQPDDSEPHDLWIDAYVDISGEMANRIQHDPRFKTFALHLGDWVCFADMESHWQNHFFTQEEPDPVKLLSQVPMMGCRGNHEKSGTLYKKYYPYDYEPYGFYYSFDYGPIHFTILDNYINYGPDSKQFEWMVNDLESTTKPWKVVAMHEPSWSSAGDKVDLTKDYLHPVFVAYNVDVVFNGHVHIYSLHAVDGIPYITSGGGNGPLEELWDEAAYQIEAKKLHHYLEVSLLQDTMFIDALDTDGDRIDKFTIRHTRRHDNMPASLYPSTENEESSKTMFIREIQLRYLLHGKHIHITVTISIVNTEGAPVEAAVVAGNWMNTTLRQNTNEFGVVTVTEKVNPEDWKPEITFTVTDVSKEDYTYEESFNAANEKTIKVS